MPTLRVRLLSALLRALGATVRLGRTVLVGLFFSVASAVLAYLGGLDAGHAALTLLSFPIGLALAFLWFLARNLLGWSSFWTGIYERHGWEIGDQTSAPKHLSLSGPALDSFAAGIRCVVREPSGVVSVCTRAHAWNGFRFPSEFPELIPPAPGKHHAVWLGGTSVKRWWLLVEHDFEVPPMLIVS